jgi:PIF1-like helicase
MQYAFKDSVIFHGNILDDDFPISEEVEQYCHNVVILFMPFRCNNDLIIEGKYTNCLRNGIQQNTIYPLHKTFLQYLLDSKSNNLRFKIQADDLQRSAEHFHAPLQETNDSNDVNDSILHFESNDILNNEQSINLVDYLLSDTDTNSTNTNIPASNLLEYKLNEYDCLPDVTRQNVDDTLYSDSATFLETIDDTNNNDNVDNNSRQSVNKIEMKKKDLMSIFIYNNNNCNLNLKKIIGADVNIVLKEANGTSQSIINWATSCPLDASQKRAFEVITGYYILSYINSIPNLQQGDRTDTVLLEEKQRLQLLVGYSKIKSDQLICFLHGPAGSGKSTIIALLQSYSQKYHELLKFQSYNRAIVITAMTGVAATIIGGETVHSALHLKKNINSIPSEAIDLWANTKLLIIDEISFANNEEIDKMNENLADLKNSFYVPFGGINVIFCGDLRQLEPVRGFPLYKNHENLSSTFKIHVNCYIELNGSHRFAADPEWGQLLLKFRNGEPEDSDIDIINTKVIQIPTDTKKQLTLPSDIKYATYTNCDRDCINTAIFHKKIRFSKDNYHHTNNFIMIFCDNIKIKKNVKDEFVELTQPARFYKQCTESSLKSDRSGKMDPVLKLYIGCEVMITENIDVPNGLANGTRAKINKILLKQGFQYMTVSIGDNLFVKGIYASQIESITMIHIMQNVQQRTFKIKPKATTFKAEISIPNSVILNHLQEIKDKIIVRFTQFPIIINVATTGHKLQGTGVDKLFVHTWRYDKNWPYVVLSRVKTFDGLYLRTALRKNNKTNYKLHPDYISFITYFTQLSPLTVDYDSITNNTN